MTNCKWCMGKIEEPIAWLESEPYHSSCQKRIKRKIKLKQKDSWLDDLVEK